MNKQFKDQELKLNLLLIDLLNKKQIIELEFKPKFLLKEQQENKQSEDQELKLN